MSSISPTATIIYSGIIAAVITIAVNIILFHKLWEKGNKSRDEGIAKQGHANTPQPQLIDQETRDDDNVNISIPPDHSVGDQGHLCVSVQSPTPPTTSEPQFIGQNAREDNISVPAQASTTTPPPHGDMGGGEVSPIALPQGPSNFQISERNATLIQNGDRQFTRIQRNFVYDYISNSITLPNVNCNLKKHVLTQSVTTLPRAEAMSHDYQNKKSALYFKDTTVALLREMADCVTGSSECRMYILSGRAGMGKSTVAYTIASRAAGLNLLGASFRFSRDETDRNNAKRFFTTIAYQLCVYNEAFAKAIGDVLETERGSAATTEDPQDQLQALILDPLRSIVQSHSRPVLIVVDALHECDEKDVISVLAGLGQLVHDLPSFKVILTTRPQLYLDHFFSSLRSSHKFHLQDIENKVVDGDIRLYLKHCLSLDQVQICFPLQQWRASNEEIDSLVRTAGRFFIIASTAVRYILDKTVCNPAAQMHKLLRNSAQDYTDLKNLDRFYTVILRDVVPEDCEDNGIICRYQSVVGTILLVQHPLPVSTLAHLLGIDVEEIRAVLDKLQSVIILGDDDLPRIYHRSFPEFLVDQSRCKDLHLRIDPKICHTQIAMRCFEIMNKHLKHNILCFGDPTRFMSNEEGLKEEGITDEQLQEKIPQQLRYACVYWVNYLEAANVEDTDLMDALDFFLSNHVLHWFEVLSLVGQLDLAHLAIIHVLKLLKLSSDLYQLLSDGARFIERFYEIIKQSALHTYYSALVFIPTDTHLCRRYIKEAMHIYAIEGGPEKYQHAFIAKMRHGHDISVDVVKFSLDSSLFMACTEKSRFCSGMLKIWGATTGTPISVILGDRFAVANDFSTIASSKDKTVMLYNLDGTPSGARFNTSSEIQKLALSSESSRVAATLSDGTVWLWESKNAELIDSFDVFEHSEWPKLKFSPTGKRLAYSSPNGINLRDGINGRFVADLQGESNYNFEFSADGSRIASLSYDNSLTLWDSESGGLISEVREVALGSLAISANGSLIATIVGDNVTLWGENNDSLVQIKVLELNNPSSITFSLNNILAIATNSGVKLYNLKTHSLIHSLPFYYRFSAVLAFSPDCTRLAPFSDGSMNLWDIRSIDVSSPLSEDATPVTALALSRDCSRLACGFKDGTVELWSTSPTKRRIASHQAHMEMVLLLGFGPDGGLFVSGSTDGILKLWNGEDGSLRGTLEVPIEREVYVDFDRSVRTVSRSKRSNALWAVSLSNTILVGVGAGSVTLWRLDTLSLIHTFPKKSYEMSTVSIAGNNAFIAIADSGRVSLLDAVNYKIITTFDFDDQIRTMTFLPDNLHLVVQSFDGNLLLLNLINKHITKGATLEHRILLPNTSLWRGVPIWHCQDRNSRQHCFAALFSQHKSPVPVLWIPTCIDMTVWTQGSSMIALGCCDGRVILLRLPATSSQVG